MKYVGKKSWLDSAKFWLIYFVATLFLAYVIGRAIPTVPYVGLIVSILIFVLLAHYWYKFKWSKSLALFAVAFVIDLIIMGVILFILIMLIGFTLAGLFGSLFPAYIFWG